MDGLPRRTFLIDRSDPARAIQDLVRIKINGFDDSVGDVIGSGTGKTLGRRLG